MDGESAAVGAGGGLQRADRGFGQRDWGKAKPGSARRWLCLSSGRRWALAGRSSLHPKVTEGRGEVCLPTFLLAQLALARQKRFC